MFAWINDGLYAILKGIQGFTVYWGLAIIVFTILVRLVLTPLDIKSRASMRKTQKLQPQLQALQKKYANDKEKLNAKTAELYKKAHVNPLSSCLPLLLTWPILIAVFGAMRAVANSGMLEQVAQILSGNQENVNLESFLWVKNLWMADNLFANAYPDYSSLRIITDSNVWVNWYNAEGSNVPALLSGITKEWIETLDASVLKNIPQTLIDKIAAEGFSAGCFDASYLQGTIVLIVERMKTIDFYREAITAIPGATIPLVNWSMPHLFNGLLLLPILSAVSQLFMTKIMNGNQPAPATEGPGAGTGKFMKWFFPIFSLWICLSYSAAFALYWVAGNLVSMGQTYAINKYLDKKEAAAAEVAGEGSVK